MIAWIILFTLMTIAVAAIWARGGPRRAVVAAIFLALLTPEWVRLNLDNAGLLWINLRLAVGIVSLCLYLLHPKSTYNFKLVWADYAMLGLIAVHFISDTLNGGFSLALFLRIYGEWVMPYLAGRVALQAVGDVKAALPWALTVATIFAALGAAESIFQITPNPWELIVGVRVGEVRDVAIRAGYKRAYGPTMDPVFFSVYQFLFFSWAIYGATRSFKGEGSIFRAGAPLANALGILATLSRAPFVAMAFLLYVMQMVLYPRLRVVFGVVAAFGIVMLLVAWNPIMNALESVSGESRQKMTQTIGGKERRATSTTNRINLFYVYDDALRGAGPFGYGTANCSSFPPRVPLHDDPGMAKYVDNAFLLYTLRFGYLGLLCFAAANVAAAYQFVQLALRVPGDGTMWFAAMAGLIVAMMFELCTVFMPPDFGFFYLFTLGASSGLWAEHLHPLVGDKESSAAPRRRRRSSSRSSSESSSSRRSSSAREGSGRGSSGRSSSEPGSSEDHSSERRSSRSSSGRRRRSASETGGTDSNRAESRQSEVREPETLQTPDQTSPDVPN